MTMPTVWVERGAMKDRWGEYRTITYEIPDSTAEAEESALAIYTPLTAFTAWAHTTDYTAGAVVSDPDSGPWACLIEHTSAGTGTFAADRAANPAYWTQTTVEIFRPILRRVRVQRQVRPGLAWLTCFYEPPTIKQFLQNNVGRGILTMDVTTSEVRQVTDFTSGTALNVWNQKWDTKDHKLYRWAPVSGKGTTFEKRCMFRLQLICAKSVFATLMDLAGCVNNAALPSFFNAEQYSLLCHGGHASRALTQSALYELDILLEYSPDTFNGTTEVQKYEWRIQQLQVYDSAGSAISGRFQEVGDWLPTGASYTVNSQKSADFSAIDRIVGW